MLHADSAPFVLDHSDLHCRFGGGTSVLMVSHGLALRLFLMRWLHWTVDEFLQVWRKQN